MATTQTFDVFNPEVWSPVLNRAFEKKLVAAKFFTNYSDGIAGKGDKLWIPAISNGFTATAVNTTSGDIANTALSDTKSALTIDRWLADAFVISDFQKATIGAQYNLQEEYVKKMGYNLAEKLDTDLLALTSGITKGLGDSATSLTSTVIETAIAFLESSSIDVHSDCAFILHPNCYWREVLASSKLTTASTYGKAILPTAPQSELYGIPVYITPNVPAGTAGTEGGHRNLLIHKKAVVYAVEKDGITLHEKQSESLRTKYIADVMYGKVLLNAGSGVRLISNY